MKTISRNFLTDSLSILGSLGFACIIVFWFLGDQAKWLQVIVFSYFILALTEQYVQNSVITKSSTGTWQVYVSPIALLMMVALSTTLDAPSENLLGLQILGTVVARVISVVTHDRYNKTGVIMYGIVFVFALALLTVLPDFWVVVPNPDIFVTFLKIGAFAIWLWAGVTIYKFLQIRNTTERYYLEEIRENEFYHKLFSLISHNLRNSLSIVLSRVDLVRLLAKKDPSLDPMLPHSAPIETGAMDAFRLVSAVLKQNVAVDDLQETTTVTQVVDKLIEEYSQVIPLTILGQSSLTITQRERLAFGLCFDVFLSNSQKYGATKVVFTLTDEAVLLSDDGPGVSPERLSYLGVQKVVSSSSTGTGNGLLLSKQLLGLLGWTIDLQSEIGAGMTIHLHRLEA